MSPKTRHSLSRVSAGLVLASWESPRAPFTALAAASFAVLVMLAISTAALAGGTPACTEITNRASASYNIGATQFTQDSNAVTTTVAELLDVSVVWQDATYVTVSPGDTGRDAQTESVKVQSTPAGASAPCSRATR